MNNINIPEQKPSILEKFGLYYLNTFKQPNNFQKPFSIADSILQQKVNQISIYGILLSCLIGVICVFPTIWVDIHYEKASPYIHYSWVATVTLISIIIELYLLFLLALKTVHQLSALINIKEIAKNSFNDGPFSVIHILSRTALEIPDPELKILGIDPFKQISKKNLFILSLLYKAKIFVSNLILKYGLLFLGIKSIFGISILYEALIVEAFWNSVVIIRVIKEARLRLFGFALAHEISENVLHDNLIKDLSLDAKTGCLRAIGNAVVMTKNYHPNMIILLLKFQELLQIKNDDRLDSWELFIETINNVSEKERNFLLDLFTVSAAFDGKLSDLEILHLNTVYGKDYQLYLPRLKNLTHCLKKGKLNEALSLCQLDFIAG